MAEPVRIAIAGAGSIGSVHARAIRQTPGVELCAVLGRDRERLQAFAREHGFERVYLDPAELAADPEVDAVIVATPNRLHVPLSVDLLRAGKHVLVEKPMATSAEGAERLAQTARDCDRRLMVGQMWRFDREALRLREIVQRGELGEIVKTKSYGVHVAWGPSGWFTRAEQAGGGALIDMGVHAIDTARFLLGDPEPLRVYASLETRYGDYDVDDAGMLMLSWSNGTVSLIESGWWHPHADGPEASTQLFGTLGYARLFPTEVRRIDAGRQRVETLAFPERSEHCDPHLYEGQLAEFAAAIRAEREPVPGAAHGCLIARVCDAAYRSAREQRVVELQGG